MATRQRALIDAPGTPIGPFESALGFGTSVLNQPVSGLAALAKLFTSGPEASEQTLNQFQDALTFQPRTVQGQDLLEMLQEAFAPGSGARALGMTPEDILSDPLNFMAGPIAGVARKVRPIEAFHGTNADITKDFKLDPSKIGTGGFEGITMNKEKLPRAFYFSTSKDHAEFYGIPHKAQVSLKNPKKINMKSRLEDWARQGEETGEPMSAQELIDTVYDGHAYDAFDLDGAMNSEIRAAAKEGFDGVIFDFGKLKHKGMGEMKKIIAAFDPNKVNFDVP